MLIIEIIPTKTITSIEYYGYCCYHHYHHYYHILSLLSSLLLLWDNFMYNIEL